MDQNLKTILDLELSAIIRRAYEAGFRDGFANANDGRSVSTSGTVVSSLRKTRSIASWGTVRPAIFSFIVASPGATATSIAAGTGLKPWTVRGTLIRLVAEGFLTEAGGTYRAIDPADGAARLAKKETISAQVMSILRRSPDCTTEFIAQQIGQKGSSVRSILYRLREKGVIEGSSKGWRIKARRKVESFVQGKAR